MNNTINFSIIIPTKNIPDLLQRCLESIPQRSDIEIIVVDDGSTDQTTQLLHAYSNLGKIKLIEKENGGQSDARNIGIKNANGQYITFIDSDDTIEKNTLLKNMSILTENPSIDILQYPILYFWTSDHEISYKKNKDEIVDNPQEIAQLLITERISGSPCDKIYRKSLFNTVQFPVGQLYEDMYTQPALFKQAPKIYLSNQGEYKYRFREGSTLNHTPSSKIIFDRLAARLQLISFGIQSGVESHRIHKTLIKSYTETASDFKYLTDKDQNNIYRLFNNIHGIRKVDCFRNLLLGKYGYTSFRMCLLHNRHNVAAIFQYLLRSQ